MFELYRSLVRSDDDRPYTYDMYTAEQHEWVGDEDWLREQRSAVGILDGIAALDEECEDKENEEKNEAKKHG